MSRHPASNAGSAWPLLVAVGLLMLGNGLLGSVLGVRSELEDFPTAATGVVMASYYVGFLFGSQLAPASLTKVGHVRVFAGLASLASTASLIHVVAVQPTVWALMRFVSGFCLAGLYVVAESWLNEQATNTNRGRLLGSYMVVVMGGIGLGQLLLGLGDPAEFHLFVLASVLVSFAVIPISLGTSTSPELDFPARIPFRQLWSAAPVGFVGGLGAGLANGALLGMGAVYATRAGMSVGRVAVFMGAAMVGAVVLQWPIGALSDRVRRRRVILAVTLAAAGVAAAATQMSATGVTLLGVMLLYGGLSFPLYSLSLSHINDHLEQKSAVAASSAYVFVVGVGAIAGPLLAAWSMAAWGPEGFFRSLVLIHSAAAVFVIYRIVAVEGLPADEQKPYANMPARASAVISYLTSYRRKNG